MMASVDEIIHALETAFSAMDDQAKTVMRWGKAAVDLRPLIGEKYTEQLTRTLLV